MLKTLPIATWLGAALLGAATASQALTFAVDARANSSSGGVGAETVSLLAGQSFSVHVDPADLWSAGALPRWSNADGLSGPRWASGSDESSQAAGTVIGRDFGLHTQAGLSAPYGTLVGQIGGGAHFVVGTSFSGLATQAGTLKLSYWDSNFGDNSQAIQAQVVSGVPEPQTYAMLLAGMVAVGFVVGRRQRPG